MSAGPSHAGFTPPGPEPPSGPGHSAARRGRSSIEEALLAIALLPLDLPRADLRDRLLRAVHCAYLAIDSQVITAAHLDGLIEAAAMARESRALLERAGDPAFSDPLRRAVAHLAEAEAAMLQGAEAVRQIHLARRTEVISGPAAGALRARPMRASVGLPELHAPARLVLLPHVSLESGDPPRASAAAPVTLATPRTLAELEAFAADAFSGALAERLAGQDRDEPTPAPAGEAPYAPFEPAVEEVQLLRDIGRDCLEDLAAGRSLRKPNAMETWLDQEPFEQRLLDNLDAFAALGGSVLPLVSLFHAEAKAPDPERAFAVALTLGCIEGSDTVGAAVMTLKQSAPEEYPGWMEGFWLAPSPAIDVAMADLTTSARPEHVALALDVLHARGQTPDHVVEALLERPEPKIAARVARALATALPRRDAIETLERICGTTEDDDLFLAAVASLLQRGGGAAVHLLRRAVDAPTSDARRRRALPLLCLVGRVSDLDRLLAAAHDAPTAPILRGLGRYGHVESLGTLLDFLRREDVEVVAAAAEALDRITGAGLREIIEEPWEVELPPEAAAAGGIPVPLRKVERVVTDPARWSAWMHEEARRLDARLRTRGGVPFSPMQIVNEIEAKSTPPDRREEAALELAVLTGIPSLFSPHDWVARQKKHLAELRAHVATIAFTPGGWASGAAGGSRGSSDVPARPLPIQAPAAPRSQPGTSHLPAFLPHGPVLPFKSPSEAPAHPPAVERDAGDTRRSPPPGAPTGVTATPQVGSPFGSTLMAPPQVARNPLPFQPASPSRAASQEGVASLSRPSAPPLPPPAPEPLSAAATPAPTSGPISRLTLAQYASLCAELAVSPRQSEAIFERYGLVSHHDRLAVDKAWQERLSRVPDEHRSWQGLYQHYQAYWADQARRGGAR
ncbi:HEAT repeat domain-containing protein [Sorangium sp. So ce1014]|uniref:HEAT repeat domain-containing protein n=1 Tax=Sorangium sp. So ce1014 TaxID=3133326 RepID=UPI003F5F669E